MQGALEGCSISTAWHILTQEAKIIQSKIELKDPEMGEYFKLLNAKLDLVAQAAIVKEADKQAQKTRNVSLSASGVAFDNETALQLGEYLEVKMILGSVVAVIAVHAKVVCCRQRSRSQQATVSDWLGLCEYSRTRSRIIDSIYCAKAKTTNSQQFGSGALSNDLFGLMVFSAIHRQFLQYLADGQFHSGSALAASANVSRSAVWKHIQGFAALGIEVIAVTGKGYRLEMPLSLLAVDAINAELAPDIQCQRLEIEIFEQCESTNSYLMAEARRGKVGHKICLAEYQSAGKGRRGRQWVSSFGQNIMLSVLWHYESGTTAIAGLSLAIGVAVVRALKNQGIAGAGLKWPNDIFWQGKKLGGILIEVAGEASGPCAVVVGLGLNGYLPIKVATEITQAWVDLKHISGLVPNRNHFAAALLNEIIPVLAGFEQIDLSFYLQEWRHYDCMFDQAVTVLLHNQAISGIVKGIDDEGLLLLQVADGSLQAFTSGEISFNR